MRYGDPINAYLRAEQDDVPYVGQPPSLDPNPTGMGRIWAADKAEEEKKRRIAEAYAAKIKGMNSPGPTPEGALPTSPGLWELTKGKLPPPPLSAKGVQQSFRHPSELHGGASTDTNFGTARDKEYETELPESSHVRLRREIMRELRNQEKEDRKERQIARRQQFSENLQRRRAARGEIPAGSGSSASGFVDPKSLYEKKEGGRVRRIQGQFRDRAFYHPVTGELIKRPSTMRKKDFEELKMGIVGSVNEATLERQKELQEEMKLRRQMRRVGNVFGGVDLTGNVPYDQLIISAFQKAQDEAKERRDAADLSNLALGGDVNGVV